MGTLRFRPLTSRLRRVGRRRCAVALALVAALGTGGCQGGLTPGGLTPPVNMQVAIATGVGNDLVVRRSLDRLASQIASEFMRIHPHTRLHLRFLPEGELVERDRKSVV